MQKKSPQGLSGAIGGPAATRGMNYQIDNAILSTLDLISKSLSNPAENFLIKIEPRAISKNTLTNWDFATEPPEILYEVKLHPTRKDIIDWLERVREEALSTSNRKFFIVYNKGGGSLLHSIGQILRIFIESNNDVNNFNKLVEEENKNDINKIISYLGGNHYNLLKTIGEPIHAPELIFKKYINFSARQLAGEQGGKRLVETLFNKFHHAAPKRKTFLVRDIIDELKNKEIQLQAPPVINFENFSHNEISILTILQNCSQELALEVLSNATGLDSKDLKRDLINLEENNAISIEGELLTSRPFPNRKINSDNSTILSKALESLLDFIEKHKFETIGLNQVHNAFALAKICTKNNPLLVATVFGRLDKTLKRIGDKHLILEVAYLSIDAAKQRKQKRGKEEVEAEARALICGVSWVFQRLGRIDEARAAAQKSRQLGEWMNLEVNLAFCEKCLGRLCRIEAETLKDRNLKEANFLQSKALLQEAIERFTNLSGYGHTHPEVGDCYSLLGRTYLVAGNLPKAEEVIGLAHRILFDKESKDYLDLRILTGELEAKKGNYKEAERYYFEVIQIIKNDDDPEKNEICARAHYGLGLTWIALSNQRFTKQAKDLIKRYKDGAAKEFEKASKIWRSLGELRSAFLSEWQEIKLVENIPEKILKTIEEEDLPVRVKSVELLKQSLHKSNKHLSLRSEMPEQYLKQIINDARKLVAIEIIEW